VSKLNQIYKKENFIIVPVCSDFLIININKVFKEGHTHVKNIGVARLLIDLVLEKRLPKNPHFVDNLKRISVDKNYIEELEEFKEDDFVDYKKLMAAPSYKRIKGALRQVR
jgi:hypothetical protein